MLCKKVWKYEKDLKLIKFIFFFMFQDVQKVYKHLQQSSQLFKVPYDNFNHVDFLWGIDAPKLVYSTLVKIMQNYR